MFGPANGVSNKSSTGKDLSHVDSSDSRVLAYYLSRFLKRGYKPHPGYTPEAEKYNVAVASLRPP